MNKRSAGVICFVALLLVVCGIYFSYSYRGLYADGSFSMATVVRHYTWFFDFSNTRQFAYSLIYAIPFGAAYLTQNIEIITMIFSACSFFIPALFWVLALYFARNDLLLSSVIIILLSMVFLGANVFSMGTHNVAYAISACIFALGLRDAALSLRSRIITICMVFSLIRSYEAVVLFFPLIMFIFFMKVKEDERSKFEQSSVVFLLMLGCVSGAGICQAILGYYSQAYDPTRSIVYVWTSLLHINIVTVSILALFAFALHVAVGNFCKINKFFPNILFVGCALLLFFVYINYNINPWVMIESRVMVGYLMFICMLTLCVFRFFKPLSTFVCSFGVKNSHNLGQLYAIPLLLLVFSGAVDLKCSKEHREYINIFSAVVNAGGGDASVDDIPELAPWSKWGWGWTYPTMSQVLRQGESYRIVLNPKLYKNKWPEEMLKKDVLGPIRWGG